MIHETESLIERQLEYLLSRDGSEFFLQLKHCMRVLGAEPRVAALMSELREEAAQLERDRVANDERETARLIELKNRLLAKEPEADDSTRDEPTQIDPLFYQAWFGTFAAFNAVAEGRRKPWPEGDGTKSHCLAQILGTKLDALRLPRGTEANQRPDLDDLSLELVNIREEHDYWVRESKDESATSPGWALIELEGVVNVLNPAPARIRDFDERLANAFRDIMSGLHEFRFAVYANKDLGSLNRAITKFKAAGLRFYQGLRLKVGTRRSALALLRRFKARCQIHDQVRMRALAAAAEVDELAFTRELALWFFDQGFNPITEVPIAGVRPDILDASRDPASALYIEAKQYKQGDSIRQRVQRGMYQVYTSVGRLRGDHLDITEAFLVIFRRSGALVHLPEQVAVEGYVVFPIVIDLAEQTGSRERERPIKISLAELRPEVVQAVSEAEGQ